MENHPLVKWLQNAYQIVCFEISGEESDSPHDELIDEDMMLLTVASGLFGFDINSIEQAATELTRISGLSIPVPVCRENYTKILSSLLIYAVSEDSVYRASIVGGIMSLEASIQAVLMHIIQNTTQDTIEEAEPTESDVNEDTGHLPDASIPSINQEDCSGASSNSSGFEASACAVVVRPRKESPPTVGNSSFCSNCAFQDGVVQRLTAELADQQMVLRNEIVELRNQMEEQKSRFVDAELVIVNKDEKIFQMNNSVLELNKQLAKMEATLQRNKELQEEIAQLQDQIDVFKPQADKLNQTEALLDKLRTRLEDMSSVKQQLQQESAKHSATHSQLLELEQEVTALRKLKPQLEEYRDQHAESTIALGELRARLGEKEESLKLLTKEIDALRGNSGHHFQQSQQLAEQLHATEERLRESERAGGVGEGMSELNPELMHQLDKLTKENQRLLEQIDQSSLLALEAKDKTIAEQGCVNSSLQKKLMATKDALDKATQEIIDFNALVVQLREQFSRLEFSFNEHAVMHSEEVRSWKAVHAKKLSTLQKQHDNNLAVIHTTHTSQVYALNNKLSVAMLELDTTRTALQETTAVKDATTVALKEAQSSLLMITHKRKREQFEHSEAIANCETAATAQLTAARAEAAMEQANLQQAHAAALAIEQQNIAELNAELEEEAIKRRKVERQKKFHEIESMRLKSQLQAAGASGLSGSRAVGEELECAVKEMKYMQQQLDAAKAEIAMLRSAGGDDASHRFNTSSASAAASHAVSLTASPRIKVSAHPLSASKERVHSNSSYSSLRGPAVRNLRGGGSSSLLHDSAADFVAGSTSAATGAISGGSTDCGTAGSESYFEQVEFAERRIEQLVREKREMLSKNLEETKEKNELSQKLLMLEKDNTSLKADVRKLTLEKERAERKLRKQTEATGGGLASGNSNKENVLN